MGGKPQLLSQRNNTLPQLLPGLSKEGHQPHGLEVLPSTLRKEKQVAGESYRPREVTAWVHGTYYEVSGIAFWDSTRVITGCLGEKTKVGKGRDQGGLGRSKNWKIEGWGIKGLGGI